jgi:HlyD family secretion protein
MLMKITQLKRLNVDDSAMTSVRGTAGQDAAVGDQAITERRWRRIRQYALAGGAMAVALIVLTWGVHAWVASNHVIPADRIRTATVQKGHYIRDVAAQGAVVAPVNPTLFAIAAGTVSYAVRAGDAVHKGEVLASVESPDLNNEYQRERATLDSLNAALARQEIEIRRQLLTGQQQADLAQVAIKAAEREMKRAQWAWDIHAMSERDYQHAIDEVSTAKLNFDHARETAGLERDSVVLDLRTRRLERDRQSLVVDGLKQRIDDLTVRSPVDGMVANLGQSEKAHVAESAPLLTVVDLTALEIEFRVGESYAGDIKPGMSADITLGGHTVSGTVTALSPEVRQNEVTGRVKFNASEQGLRQNERASLRIILDERDNVVKLERGADIDETTRAMYVVQGDRAVRTPVQLGSASMAEIEVIRGLVPGDTVIISGTRDFKDAPELLIGR